MNETNYMKTLCENITSLRKENGFTQDQFASKLGVTFQAISKWENEVSCPDICLLPEIAQVFNVSIDRLFGLALKKDQNQSTELGIDWEDDGKLRAVAFIGHKYVKRTDDARKLTLELKGPALDVISSFSVSCGDVTGNISAGGSVNTGDVKGNISANGSVNAGDIEGTIAGNGSVNCGNITGGVNGNGSINADNIDGDVTTSGNVNADAITGNVYAENVDCDEIDGEVHCVTREELRKIRNM